MLLISTLLVRKCWSLSSVVQLLCFTSWPLECGQTVMGVKHVPFWFKRLHGSYYTSRWTIGIIWKLQIFMDDMLFGFKILRIFAWNFIKFELENQEQCMIIFLLSWWPPWWVFHIFMRNSLQSMADSSWNICILFECVEVYMLMAFTHRKNKKCTLMVFCFCF